MRVVRDRDNLRPGYYVQFDNGELEQDGSEYLNPAIISLCKMGLVGGLTVAILIGVILLGIQVGNKGGFAYGIWTITLILGPPSLLLTGWLRYIARYNFDGPIGYRTPELLINSSLDEMKETLKRAIEGFEKIGFDGYMSWVWWNRHEHSRIYYQAMIDSLGRLERDLGPSGLLNGLPSSVVIGLQIADVKRNIKELNGLAGKMFMTIYRYPILAMRILVLPATVAAVLAILSTPFGKLLGGD